LVQLWLNFDNEINRALMSSIVPGFEYDVFISYRQKDNKRDRWVSEFVEARKTEVLFFFPYSLNKETASFIRVDIGSS
jgi:hypothetical protein